jgi:hypothetical protein
MSSTDGLVFAGLASIAFVINVYGEWYWRLGKGKVKKLRKRR